MRTPGMAILAIVIVPGLLVAQNTSRTRGRDTTRAGRQQTSAGEVGRGSRTNMGLTRDQVTQLQTALQQADCDPGPIDGVIGPRTRRAIACARQKNNLTGNNANDLLRSLNLNFTAPDSMGMGGVMRRGRPGARPDSGMGQTDTSRTRRTGGRGMNRTSRDSSMRRPRNDSARRPGRPDSTRRP